jgi:transposase-like protein
MSDDELCGAETTNGTPCQNPANSCPWHNTDDQPTTGRPSKLTKQVQEAIATDLEQGRSMRSAARKQDLTPQTVMNWMQKGESHLEEGKANEYTEFFERITRAKGYGEEWYMKTIIELAEENEDHRFLMSLMKQRYPDSWGDTETGVDADTVKLEVSERVKDSWPTQE